MFVAGVTKSNIQPELKTWKWVPTFCMGRFGEEMNLTELMEPGAGGGLLWICVAEFDCTEAVVGVNDGAEEAKL